MALNLIEVDSLTATVIIDNEIDIMSSTPPDTLSNAGKVPNLTNKIEARGNGCVKEFPMENICCGAHGLSVLIARLLPFLAHWISLLTPLSPSSN